MFLENSEFSAFAALAGVTGICIGYAISTIKESGFASIKDKVMQLSPIDFMLVYNAYVDEGLDSEERKREAKCIEILKDCRRSMQDVYGE